MHQSEHTDLDPRTSGHGPSFPGLIDYLQVIVKRRRMICVVTLAAAVISIVYSLILPNIYTAKTMILPGPGG